MTHSGHAGLGLDLDLIGFLMLGLLGSVAHCIGIGSPFVIIVSRQYAGPAGRFSNAGAQLWYHAGRIVTYTLLGAAAASQGCHWCSRPRWLEMWLISTKLMPSMMPPKIFRLMPPLRA